MWTVKVAIMVRSIFRAVSTCGTQETRCPISAAPFGPLSRLAKPVCNLRVIASFSEEVHPLLTRCSAVVAPCRVPRYQGPPHTCTNKEYRLPVVLWTRWQRGRVQDSVEDAPPRTCCSQVRTAPPGGAAGRSRFEGEYLNNGLDRKTAAASAAAPARVDVGNNVEVLQ